MATDELGAGIDTGVGRTGRSTLRSLLAGEWRTATVTPLVALAAASVVLDGVTTYVVIVSPGFAEQNVVLAWLARHHPLAAVAWLVVNAGLFVLVAALSLGWVSTLAGWLVVCTNGLLGASNLVLILTGTALISMAGLDVVFAVHVLTPILGVVVGLLFEWVRHGLPWRETLLGLVLYLGMELGPFAIL